MMSTHARRACAAGATFGLVGLIAAPAHAAIVAEPVTVTADDAPLTLSPVGTYETGVFDESAAEIVAFHATSQQLYVVNALAGAIDVVDASDPASPTLVDSLDVTQLEEIGPGAEANSVAVRRDGLIAVAVETETKTDPGWIAFFDATGAALGAVPVGAQPDNVQFSPDGRYVVSANEGEPNDDYTVDPEGSVSVVRLSTRTEAPEADAVSTATFHAYEADGGKELPEGVRVFAGLENPVNPVSENLEPEYVAIDQKSRTAYVTLQENNAVAVVNLRSATVTDLWALGATDHLAEGNGLDPSNRDEAIAIENWPISGLYMPDAIAAYKARGGTYLVTANEGDAREWGDYEEGVGFDDLAMCADSRAALFAAERGIDLDDNEYLGRIDFTPESGFDEAAGCYTEAYAFGARSFSIWTTDGELVFDPGDDFEQITAAALPDYFNASNDENGEDAFDDRSDNKGPEPEGVAIGEIRGQTYAFIGLERVGGIMVYDITVPSEASFVTYINNRDFTVDAESAAAGDLGPEGLAFISAKDSPTRTPMLAVGNEVSGTTTLFAIDVENGRSGKVSPSDGRKR